MMSPEALNAKLDDMLKDTKAGHLKWRLEIETSEYEDRGVLNPLPDIHQ